MKHLSTCWNWFEISTCAEPNWSAGVWQRIVAALFILGTLMQAVGSHPHVNLLCIQAWAALRIDLGVTLRYFAEVGMVPFRPWTLLIMFRYVQCYFAMQRCHCTGGALLLLLFHGVQTELCCQSMQAEAPTFEAAAEWLGLFQKLRLMRQHIVESRAKALEPGSSPRERPLSMQRTHWPASSSESGRKTKPGMSGCHDDTCGPRQLFQTLHAFQKDVATASSAP